MLQTEVVEKIKTRFMFTSFFLESRAVYELMWQNKVEWGRPQMTMWRMRIACWIPKAANTQSKHIILIAFSQQQWSRERD
jgi:hypothetical protein